MMAAVTDHNPYNCLTLQYFENPVHAGDLDEQYSVRARALVEESMAGARVEMVVGLLDGKLKECRYRVFGCPHLLAACEWLCSYYEGKTLLELQQFRAADCMVVLQVPIEKTGRILLLEDAIRSLSSSLSE